MDARSRAGASPLDPAAAVVCDCSLDSTRFRRDPGYTPPTWESMIEELAREA